MEKLRAIYKSPSAMEDNWRQSANPKLDLNPEFEHLLKNSTGRDKALLKAIYMKQMNPESKSETAIFLDKKWAYWLKY
jgi:hypothetical protein